MIKTFEFINPKLPFEEKWTLHWLSAMRAIGWNFIVESDFRPSKYDEILLATGNEEEFLIYTGGLRDNKWYVQNYPSGRVNIDGVIAWMYEPATNDKMIFNNIIGTALLAGVTSKIKEVD